MADWNRDRAEEMRVWASRTPGRGRTPSIPEHAAWRLLTIQQDEQAGGNRPLTPRQNATAVDTHAVRAWAKGQGIDIKESGRVPADVVARYREATGQ